MPGKRITDHQVHRYKQHRNKFSQAAAAAKAGISERSARRIEDAAGLPSQRAANSGAQTSRYGGKIRLAVPPDPIYTNSR